MGSCFGSNSNNQTGSAPAESGFGDESENRARDLIRDSQISGQYNNNQDYKFQFHGQDHGMPIEYLDKGNEDDMEQLESNYSNVGRTIYPE